MYAAGRMKRVAGLTKREVPLLHYIIPLQEYHDAHHDRMDDHPGHHVLRRRSDVPCRHVHVLRRRGVIFIGHHPTKFVNYRSAPSIKCFCIKRINMS